MVSIQLRIEVLPFQLHVILSISTVQLMHHMSNLLLRCHYQHFLSLLNTHVELPIQFLRHSDRVSCFWLHHIDIRIPNVYASDDSFRHRSLHEHISNAEHDSVCFELANFQIPYNLTDIKVFLLLLSPYWCQSNRLRISFHITRHENVSTLHDFTLSWNYWIKFTVVPSVPKGTNTFSWAITSFQLS